MKMQHGMVTPSPRSRKSSLGESSPSQMLFTHEEIVVLKLLFSLFDRKSKVKQNLQHTNTVCFFFSQILFSLIAHFFI